MKRGITVRTVHTRNHIHTHTHTRTGISPSNFLLAVARIRNSQNLVFSTPTHSPASTVRESSRPSPCLPLSLSLSLCQSLSLSLSLRLFLSFSRLLPTSCGSSPGTRCGRKTIEEGSVSDRTAKQQAAGRTEHRKTHNEQWAGTLASTLEHSSAHITHREQLEQLAPRAPRPKTPLPLGQTRNNANKTSPQIAAVWRT